MTGATTIGALFKPLPAHWGLRGDPFLWKDLARVFRAVPLPDSADTLHAMLESAFLALTAESLSTIDEAIFVERYQGGGMSSGHVSPRYWREECFPMIVQRFKAQLG